MITNPFKSCFTGIRDRRTFIKRLIAGSGTLCVVLALSAQKGMSLDLPVPSFSAAAIQDTGIRVEDLKQILMRKISLKLNDVSIAKALTIAAESANVRIIFNDKHLAPFKDPVKVDVANVSAAVAFDRILTGTNLYVVPSTATTVVVKQRANNRSPGSDSTKKASFGSIAGQVVDSSTGKPVAGATVVLVKDQRVVNTNESGMFRFADVPFGTQTLSVRLLGYQSRLMSIEITEEGKVVSRIVTLARASTTLTEVVTTATGSQRRVEISNDVLVIDADKITQSAPIRSVTDLLIAAQIPGANITRTSGQPGAPSRIRLGGVGSISQNNDPVIIVDGVWIKSAFSTSEITRRFSGNGANNGALMPSRLDDIDPAIIETIEIVRGPAAATLYGPDAANGVIKITTKRGSAGPARWDLRVSRDWSTKAGRYPLEYMGFGTSRNSSLVRECGISEVLANVCTQDSVVGYDKNGSFLGNEGNGYTNTYSATVSGGTPQITYRLSATVQDQQGTRRTPVVDEIRLNKLNLPFSRLDVPSIKRDRGMSASLTLAPRQGLDITLNVDGAQSKGYENNVDVTKSNGAVLGRTDTSSMLKQNIRSKRQVSLATTTTALINVLTNWNPVPWWSGNVTLGMDRGYSTEAFSENTNQCVSGTCEVSESRTGDANRRFSVYTVRSQSSFFPSLGWAGRFVTVRPGITADMRREINSGSNMSVITPASSGNGITGVISEPAVKALAGIGANVYIRLFDRISFDPALRRDFGSSKSLRNNAKTYPRFGTSWLVSDESFFPQNYWVNSFRLRAAMGYAAVQPDLGAINGSYNTSNLLVNGIVQPTYYLKAPGNTQLEPERSFEIESGFDADLLDNRIQLTLTHSSRRNTNTLISRTLAPSAGAEGDRQENLAKVVNRLTSLQLNTLILDRASFTMRVGVNMAIHDNQIKTLGPGVSPFGLITQRNVAGYPVGGLWTSPILGINDANGNGFIEGGEIIFGDTAVYVGTNMPRYTTGYNFEVTAYQNFRFNAFLDYKGDYVQNRNSITLWNTLRGKWDVESSLDEQALAYLNAKSQMEMQSISELRLQSASVSWNAPADIVRRIGGRSLQISLAGNNLKLWTQYRGRDPSVNSSPVGERTTDNGVLIPYPRSYSLQFRVGY